MLTLTDASSTHVLVDLFTAVQREAIIRRHAARAGREVTMIGPHFWTSPIAPLAREIKEGFVLKQRADAQGIRRTRLHLWVEVLKGTTSALRHDIGLGTVERELLLQAKNDKGYQALLTEHEMNVKEPANLRRLPLDSIWRLLDHTYGDRSAESRELFSDRDLRAVLLNRETHLISFAKHVPEPEGRELMQRGAAADREAFAAVDGRMTQMARSIRDEAAIFTSALDRGVRNPLLPLPNDSTLSGFVPLLS